MEKMKVGEELSRVQLELLECILEQHVPRIEALMERFRGGNREMFVLVNGVGVFILTCIHLTYLYPS